MKVGKLFDCLIVELFDWGAFQNVAFVMAEVHLQRLAEQQT